MTWYHDLRFRWKMIGAFALIVLLMVGEALIAHQTFTANSENARVVADDRKSLLLADDALIDLVNMQTGYRGFLLTGMERYLDPYHAGDERFREILATLKATDADQPDQSANWLALERQVELWRQETAESGIALRQRVDAGAEPAEAIFAFVSSGRGEEQFNEIRSIFDAAVALQQAELNGHEADRAAADRTLERTLLAGGAAAVLIAAAVALFLSRSIAGPIDVMAGVARDIASGSFDRRIGFNRKDEIGQLAHAFDEMAGRLQTMVQEMDRAVQTARSGETRVRAVMDSVGEGIFTVDQRGRITSFNRASERIFGRRASDAIGQPATALIAAGDGPDAAGVPNDFAIAGTSREMTGLRADGTTFPMDLIVTEMRLEGQRQTIGVARDITERRRASQRLQESGQRLRLALDAAQMGTWEWNIETGRWTWSDQVAMLHGLSRADDGDFWALSAKSIHPEDRQRVEEERARALEAGEYEIEYRTVLPDRGVRWVGAKGRVVTGANGKATRLVGVASDITARRRAENDLRESEARYRELFGSARRQARELALLDEVRTALAQELDISALVRTVVEATASIFGYTNVSVYLRRDDDDVMELQHQIGYGSVISKVQLDQGVIGHVVRTGEPMLLTDVNQYPDFLGAISGIQSEVCVPLHDGDRVVGVLNVETTEGMKLDQEDLRLVGIIGQHVDLAIRRARLFMEARESEARFAAFMNNSPAVAWMKDEQFRYRYINEPYERLVMQTNEELAGKDDFAIYPPGTARMFRANDEAVLVSGRPAQMYEVTPNVDGREITHLSFKFPFEDGSGNRFVGGVAIDVTEQRRAETELQRQFREAERARSETTAILDATAEAMMLIAPDGRVATLNHRAFELLGLDPSKTLGQPIDLVRPYLERIFDDSGRVTALIADRVAMDSVVHTEIVSQRWPEARELALSSAPVQGGDGEPLGHLFAFRDVTRERAVDRMKTEFVSLVSHELRTPLTSIKGYVDLLLDGEVGDLEPDQKEFLAIVRNNAQRLVALINDLLDISRIESGKIELRPTAVDLARLIEGATMAMRPQLDGKRQRLIVSVADNLPSIWGDADRVAQVLTNLVSNAHKYTPVNGAIRIAAECQGHQVRVDVQDTGIGLSAEEQSQLFTKFFRAENRATQEVGGTGLGLVITRSLVEMHGGTMEVVSAPGKGATFSFTLPIARRETAELTPISRAGAHGGRVLVVEDEPDIAHLIRRYLSRDGYEVLLAHNAADARRLARLERPDLITLDIMLPDANGFTLLEWLKSEEATRDIPVMLLSMLPDDNRGLVLGAVDYMVKPVQEQTLLDKVATILSGNRRLVLVADDDADTREMLCRHLKHVGCDVIEASNGEEAVAQARRHHPTLLVIDVRMPGLDGVEAVRELREDPETRDLPVIVMTGSPGVAENGADIVAQLGINRLLMKPFSAKELSASIAQGLKPVGSGME